MDERTVEHGQGYQLHLHGQLPRGFSPCPRAWGVTLALILLAGEAPSLPQGPVLSPPPVIQPVPGPPATDKPESAVEIAPMPRTIPPFTAGQIRLPRLDGCLDPFGATPHPAPSVQQEYRRYVRELRDPENTLDLILGRTRLMMLAQPPTRIQFSDPTVVAGSLLAPTELSLIGRAVGSSILSLWFLDARDSTEHVLTYLVRVLPDPEAKERLERVYKALQDEINHAFPGSLICLSLVGDKLVVSGQARDIAEATQILHVIQANMPPLPTAQIPVDRVATDPHAPPGPDGRPPRGVDDFLLAGGPNIINLLKVAGEQQVMLRVTVAEVNRAAARSIGLNFSVTNHAGLTVAANTTGNIATGGLGFGFGGFDFLAPRINSGAALGTGFSNVPVALDNGQVRLAINALRRLNYARSLAEPNLVTMNGQTATFQAGGRFPVPVVTGYTAAGLQGVNFIPFGVQLTFTPYITDRDRIRLQVAADVSSRDLEVGATTIGGAQIPNLTTRNFQTVVELREGQTLAVAGLIQNSLGADGQRIPFLSDLPIIGHLTGFDQVIAGEQELVVLITPELVHPLEHHEVTPLPGSDLFEPSDLEFYVLDRLESRYGADHRSPVRTDFDRMKQYRKCEQLYLQGAPGYAPPSP